MKYTQKWYLRYKAQQRSFVKLSMADCSSPAVAQLLFNALISCIVVELAKRSQLAPEARLALCRAFGTVIAKTQQ